MKIFRNIISRQNLKQLFLIISATTLFLLSFGTTLNLPSIIGNSDYLILEQLLLLSFLFSFTFYVLFIISDGTLAIIIGTFFGFRGNSEYKPDKEIDVYNPELSKDIERRLHNLERLEHTGLSGVELNNITTTLVNDLKDSITSGVLAEIKREHGQKFVAQERFSRVDDRYQEIVGLMSREQGRLVMWTAFNLVAGIVAAGIGAILLYYMILDLGIAGTDDRKFEFVVLGFFARLSLVLIIEVFAYFFLNLYRTGLQEIKFYQNEITNALSRQAGVRAAMYGSDKAVYSHVIKQLVDTERNFVLKKGESTVNLEQNRLDRTSDVQITEAVTKAVNLATQRAKRTAAAGKK